MNTDPRIEPAVKAWYAHNPQVHPNERMARALAAADAVDPVHVQLSNIQQLYDLWHEWPDPQRAPIPWVAFMGHLADLLGVAP